MNDTKTKTLAKPEITIRQGAVAASIWKRQAPSVFEYFDFSVSRAWKAKSSGRDGYSLNFFCDNEEQLGVVIEEASSWIAEEVELLVAKARTSGNFTQCQSPEQRARVYTVAYMTGLRKRELSSLCVSNFKLDENPPTVTVEASSSKHRKKDVLPLHPDLVQKLRSWTKGLKQTQHLFPGLERKKLSLMIRKDLEAAGIAYETVDGIADFHAAGRHTYITQLLRSGVSVPKAKELARHWRQKSVIVTNCQSGGHGDRTRFKSVLKS